MTDSITVQEMITAHMESGPKRFLPCLSPAPTPSATPTSAVQLKIIEKVSQFSDQQAARLQLTLQELAALTVRPFFKKNL